MTLFAPLYTSPVISMQVKNEFESQYIHTLFGLRDKHITVIATVFVHNFLGMMRRMEVFQNDLVNDIRRGRIKDDLNISEHVRAELNAQLTPTPERAEEIKNEFAKGFKGIIPRLWPDVKSISGLWSGSTNEMYYKEAKALTGPDVPIVSFIYSASEGFMGSNLECTRPGPPRYTLIPDVMFFEFLPIVNDRIPDLDEINPRELLLSEQLELNKTYEVIITNSSGFYRFRLGDVVRVVGFYQQAPQIEFLFRSGQNLNVNAVKISEEVLFRALREAADRWSSTLKDYTAAGSQFAPSHQGLLDPHFLLFLELDGPVLTEEQTGLVDDILLQQDEEYATFRKLGSIAKIRVYQVQPGAFSRFRAHLLATTDVTADQFKMPRVLKSSDRVDWFLENVRN
ncbi:jasmonoyl--L-amino acid synthetase JAR1-like [Pollicipes pollicipes]|uniref:jasmonoyl--L-amino acid synthetase JAR1-like n=1 Tax=Pollicipes pollicipes TaxID=41117 RepID=UPI0018850DB8|nr:jasmonoyl--L-amino acid synthetase JAR1-like [Pollicipes pollicipes]